MAIFGTLSVLRAQTEGRAKFAPAFPYLEEMFREGSEARKRMLALTIGQTEKIDLGEGMFALEQCYESRVRYDAFESHRNYIDIQVLVVGEELMEIADISKLPVTKPYDADRDVIIYGDYRLTSVLRLAVGDGAVFFPKDAHMPNLRVGADPVFVRKTVVKVPV